MCEAHPSLTLPPPRGLFILSPPHASFVYPCRSSTKAWGDDDYSADSLQYAQGARPSAAAIDGLVAEVHEECVLGLFLNGPPLPLSRLLSKRSENPDPFARHPRFHKNQQHQAEDQGQDAPRPRLHRQRRGLHQRKVRPSEPRSRRRRHFSPAHPHPSSVPALFPGTASSTAIWKSTTESTPRTSRTASSAAPRSERRVHVPVPSCSTPSSARRHRCRCSPRHRRLPGRAAVAGL